MVNWVESHVKTYLVAFFVKSFSLKPWYAMFDIFPRYHITYHDSMRWFSIFLIFLNLLCSHFKSRSNSWCPPCVLGGWGTQVCDRFWVPHLQGTSKYFSPNFLMCGLCNPRSNLNLNGFSSKISQYMDITRDNSSNLGSGIPTRSSTHENWSGGVLHTALGSHFTKKHPF
jgi:hypothetical protein